MTGQQYSPLRSLSPQSMHVSLKVKFQAKKGYFGSRNPQLKKMTAWTSLVVQWLRLCTSTAGDLRSIPGQGTKIPHTLQHGQKKKKR